MGSLLRYVWLSLANSNQSRSAFIRTPSSYFICQFLLYLLVGIWQSFVFVYLCPRVDDNAADFSRSVAGGLLCYTAVFRVLTQCSSPQWGGALRDDTKNGCVADWGGRGVGAYLPYFLLVPLRTSSWKATGDVALFFFRSLFFVKAGRYATKDGLISLQRIFQ